jgi:hypothetical protein
MIASDLFTPQSAWIMLVVSIGTMALYMLLLPPLIIRLPATYFLLTKQKTTVVKNNNSYSLWRLLAKVLKNLAGATLVMLGILMIFLPGQGFLTILVGLLLCNFPGKRKFLRWFVLKSKLAHLLNSYRRKHGRPPFLF